MTASHDRMLERQIFAPYSGISKSETQQLPGALDPRNENKCTLDLKVNCIDNNQDDTDQTSDDQFQDDCQS